MHEADILVWNILLLSVLFAMRSSCIWSSRVVPKLGDYSSASSSMPFMETSILFLSLPPYPEAINYEAPCLHTNAKLTLWTLF